MAGTGGNMLLAGNFDVTGFNMQPGFQHTGTWYDFFNGTTINVTDASGHTEYFDPGEFHLWTDSNQGTVSVGKVTESRISVFPNPAENIIYVECNASFDVSIHDLTGRMIKTQHVNGGSNTIDVSEFNSGVYLLNFTNNETQTVKKITIK
jgi:hypothetical protein